MDWIRVEDKTQHLENKGGTTTELAYVPGGLLFRTTTMDDVEGGGIAVALAYAQILAHKEYDASQLDQWIRDNKV